MRLKSVLPVTALFCALPACPALAVQPAALQQAVAAELLAADRSFSQAAEKSPVVDAIAPMLDVDVLMPLPTGKFAKGKAAVVEALRANPANNSSTAKWAPIRAGVSADGTHGFTYGFMTISASGKPDQRAKYLAYWQKRPEGWRLAAYKRAPSAPGKVETALRSAIVQQNPSAWSAKGNQLDSLKAAEKAFSDRAQQVGLGPAFAEFGSQDAMNIGQGADFTFGNSAIAANMPEGPGSPLYWAADEGGLVAPSGDLGVTFGYIRRNEPTPADRPDTIPFFTVWHRASPGAPWRYIAE